MAAGALQWGYAEQLWRVWARIRPAGAEAAVRRTNPAQRGTPEIYFAKPIDNSRLVRVADPARTREMRMFTAMCAILFTLLMMYAWQHFSAIEYGYRIEQQRAQHDSLVELNRELRLEEASLRDPERIDALARRMGLQSAQVGQVARLDQTATEAAAPVMASATPIAGLAAAR